MFPTSDKFLDTIAGSHFVAARADLLVDGEPELDLTAAGLVVDGTVQVQNDPVQRTGHLTLSDPSGDLLPTRPDDLLAPVGNEIRLWRGVLFEDGSGQELVPQGTFRFTSSRAQFPRVDFDLYDRAWVIQGAKLEQPVIIAAGTNYIEAITKILIAAYGPRLQTNFPDTDEVTPGMTFEAEADPWEICQELAGNLGLRLFFDQLGVCTMEPEPDPAITPPAWTFDDADLRNLALPGLEVSWDSTDAINAVIVTGENSDGQAFRGTAYDTDPDSPTQYGGKFGKRPDFIRDDKIVSKAQATARAKKELLRRLGNVQSITVPSLVHPALECGDIVRVVNAAQDVDQILVVDRFAVPLRAAQAMQIERSRKVPMIDEQFAA